MKKIISLSIVLAMVAALMLPLAGCGLFAKKIDAGTETAKLLLANERMDEKLLGSKIDVGISGVEKEPKPAKKISSDRPFASPLSAVSRPAVKPLKSANGHTWSKFPVYSSSVIEFNQFMDSVDGEVKRVAEDIADMKRDVGITDKWVRTNGNLQMLRVFENYDCLLVAGDSGNIHVYYRYTDETARNYYEMYSFMDYEDGTTGNIRTLYVPNERYEYMYENSNGFTDYFIAENSRGYWVNTRFNAIFNTEGDRAAFATYIIKDGLGYGFDTSYQMVPGRDESGKGMVEEHQTLWYTVFDPNTGRELFRIRDSYGEYNFELYFTAIRDGFVSVSADEFYEGVEAGVYETNRLNRLTTKKGVYTASEELKDDAFTFREGYIQYIYGDELYYGSATFGINKQDLSMDEACVAFGDHVASMGMDLHCSMDTVALSLEHSTLLSENFEECLEWNGYTLSDIEQVGNALEVLREDYAEHRAVYEAVKDYERVDDRQKLSDQAHFAALNVTVGGENRMDGTSVQIGGITVSTDDVALFEAGMQYVLKIGLSLVDEDGNPISVNTVALTGTTPTAVTFDGSSIALSASGEYAIPKNLHRGRYAAVVYVATADEGIRVSEMQKIAFVEIREGEIESAAMLIEASQAESHLILRYEIKNTRTITVKATKDAYTYAEVERMLLSEILTHGAPFHGAVPETQGGEEISPDANVGKGVYRMMCYLNSADGLAQGYVVLTLE